MARQAKKAQSRSLEQRLWDTADALRGNQEPSEYKHVVLGLVFLKYISDRFEARRHEINDELATDGIAEDKRERFLEDRDEYRSHNVFWVPAEARWESIQAKAKLPEIGQFIDTAMDLIEKENPVIRGVLPRNYGREGLDKGRLGQLVDLIGSIGFTETDDHGSDDVLGRVTVFDERSAGLRMFVALIAFLKVHGSSRPPVLPIDEAENHLHIDAQADLVNMFVTQEHAVKVIYTTHSPACLPPDLGTGIRTVVPRADNYQVSDIKNSFWQGAAGYSPLMLAMGAAAAAFTPARSVVLAEGATEMILLPTLLRAATGLTELEYQVAPGLSEVPNDFLPQLDLEAARVAYLVDGDDGGVALKKALLEAGIPEALVIDLGVPGIENILVADAYRDAIAALLPECNPGVTGGSFVLPRDAAQPGKSGSIAAAMQAWIDEQCWKAPSKVAVANWLVQNERAQPSADGAATLVELHERLSAALDVRV